MSLIKIKTAKSSAMDIQLSYTVYFENGMKVGKEGYWGSPEELKQKIGRQLEAAYGSKIKKVESVDSAAEDSNDLQKYKSLIAVAFKKIHDLKWKLKSEIMETESLIGGMKQDASRFKDDELMKFAEKSVSELKREKATDAEEAQDDASSLVTTYESYLDKAKDALMSAQIRIRTIVKALGDEKHAMSWEGKAKSAVADALKAIERARY